MAQKVNPIAVRLNFNRFSDSSWFSDYYYSTLLYQDFNFRQYLSSIKQPNANKLGFRAAKCIIHHFPKRSLIHLFCLSDPRKKDPLSEPLGGVTKRSLRALPPGECLTSFGPTYRSLDRAAREGRSGLTYTGGVTIAPYGPSLDQLTGTDRPVGGRRRHDAEAPPTGASPGGHEDRGSAWLVHHARETNAPPRLIEEEKPNVVDSAGPPVAASLLSRQVRAGADVGSLWVPGRSWRGALARPTGDSETLGRGSCLPGVDPTGAALGSRWSHLSNPGRPYWFKSSILQKKRALVNLHRGIAVAPLGRADFIRWRQQHLVARLILASHGRVGPPSLSAWYRKGRPIGRGRSQHLRRRLGALAPTMGLPPSWLINSRLPRGEFMSGAQHNTGALAPAPLIADAILGTLSLAPKPKPHQATLWSVLNRPWAHSRPGGREVPPLGRIYEEPPPPLDEARSTAQSLTSPGRSAEPRQGRVYDFNACWGFLWAHYFNFYAMHYYFMHKMGDSLGRPGALRANRKRSYPQGSPGPGGSPGGLGGRGGDVSQGLPRSRASLRARFREATLTPKGLGPRAQGPPGGRAAEGRVYEPEGRFLQANPVYLLAHFSVAARLNPNPPPGARGPNEVRTKEVRPLTAFGPRAGDIGGGLVNKNRTFVAPYSQSELRSALARSFFGSSSSNQITKSLDFYLSNVHSILSQNTNTFISLRPIKVHSVFQCASLVAQEVACKLEQKKSFRLICRLIFQQLALCNYIKGIRITCSGRFNGAEIAKTECRKFGETSLHVFSDKIDYARTEASTPYGILGVKVWISYI